MSSLDFFDRLVSCSFKIAVLLSATTFDNWRLRAIQHCMWGGCVRCSLSTFLTPAKSSWRPSPSTLAASQVSLSAHIAMAYLVFMSLPEGIEGNVFSVCSSIHLSILSKMLVTLLAPSITWPVNKIYRACDPPYALTELGPWKWTSTLTCTAWRKQATFNFWAYPASVWHRITIRFKQKTHMWLPQEVVTFGVVTFNWPFDLVMVTYH